MRRIRSESGVSEVVGTILILAMTVVLFASIIIWVASIPTPQASIRLDMDGELAPIFSNGEWEGVNITITHRGGETLLGFRTRIIFTVEEDGSFETEILQTKGTTFGTPYGLADGNDEDWHTGERWRYTNFTVEPEDKVTVTVIDTVRSILLWNEPLLGPVGAHPPLFVEKWADRRPETSTIDLPETNLEFSIFARVVDPDRDLNPDSVYVYLAFLFGTPEHRPPLRMYDDGTNGDLAANDGVFTADYTFFRPSSLSWDGGIVLFNATDLAPPPDGPHVMTSRMTLEVVEGPPGARRPPGLVGSGRPPNLNYNGLQGYNIFNGTEWDSLGFNAEETRTFKEDEEVVVVVGSAILTDTFGRNEFSMFDSFSSPQQSVVYGLDKRVTASSTPSSEQAFEFLLFDNGYNLWIYRFELNNASSVGINFRANPIHPPEYFFAAYAIELDLVDFLGNRFIATDTITVGDVAGSARGFPSIAFYTDAGFTTNSNSFNSTDNAWVAITMLDVDATTDNILFGVLSIRDFLGGTQIQKAFINGRDTNPPLCPVSLASCPGGGTARAVSVDGATRTYRFRLNLSLSDQDPWVEGLQHYSLQISTVQDTSSNERYSNVGAQIIIQSPLFRLDVVGANADTTNPAWGTHDFGYYYENLNGVDKWRKTRYEACFLGSGNCKQAVGRAVAFLDADGDGDLDVAASLQLDNNNAEINFDRRDLDANGNVVFSKFTLTGLSGNGVYCNDIETADLTGDGLPEIVCGMTDGKLWYFRNDGTWTSGSPSSPVRVDETRTARINDVTSGDFDADGDIDLAVARSGGTVTYYTNLDGLGTYSTGGTTDRWFAEGETLVVGSYVTPDFLRTTASDNDREEIREALVTENVRTGSTTNGNMDPGPAPWTYAGWENGGSASGEWHPTAGNPNGHVDVHTLLLASQTVSGYWYQSFAASGSPPYTATVDFQYAVSQFGGQTVSVYVFVDTTPGAPTVGTEIAAFSHTTITGWTSRTGINVPSSKLPGEGTYFLKFAVRTTNGAAGSTTIVQIDNAALSWQSTGGQASELKHYWRIQRLPNRPQTTFSLRIEGHHTPSTEGDSFAVAYSTNVALNDPTTGTYTTILWINSTDDLAQTFSFTENLQNQQVWMRVVDLDHRVGNTTLDTLRVDQIYIEATTQTIQPGSSITLPSTPGDATAIDSGDQDGDGFADVVVGTSAEKVYKLIGYTGGLQTPGAAFYPATGGVGATIAGIKLGNMTTANAGLEIVLGFSSKVRVISGSGGTGVQIGSDQSTPTGAAINAIAVGDVDGDGDDDVVVATDAAGPALVYFRNLGGAMTWSRIAIEPIPSGITIAIWDLDLGDGNKAQFRGR